MKVQQRHNREQSGTSFHFPLENVIDIVEHNPIDTLGTIQHIEENTPILELVQLLNTLGVVTSSSVSTATSSPRETVLETQGKWSNLIYAQFYKRILIDSAHFGSRD